MDIENPAITTTNKLGYSSYDYIKYEIEQELLEDLEEDEE